MHVERPNLVGLVCWILILSGCLEGYLALRLMATPAFETMMGDFPYPPLIAKIILFGSDILAIVCGICMYEGLGWARFVYLVGSIPYLAQSLLVNHPPGGIPWKLFTPGPVLALHVAALAILFLPKVRRYFHPPMYVDE